VAVAVVVAVVVTAAVALLLPVVPILTKAWTCHRHHY
jgi:hypothetical protein